MGKLRASVEDLMADGALSQQQNKNPCEKNEKAKIEKTFNHSLELIMSKRFALIYR